jgi:hypothetical protein
MKLVAKLLSAALLLLGLGALSVAGYFYWARGNVVEPGLSVEKPERVFDSAVVNEHYEVEFRVVNRAAEPRKVIGSELS